MVDEKIVVRADPDMADEIPWYLGQLREHAESIHEAVEKGDFETIENTGHRMKGSGVSFGFEAVSDMGASLERAAKGKNRDEVRKWSEELSRYLERLKVVY